MRVDIVSSEYPGIVFKAEINYSGIKKDDDWRLVFNALVSHLIELGFTKGQMVNAIYGEFGLAKKPEFN